MFINQDQYHLSLLGDNCYCLSLHEQKISLDNHYKILAIYYTLKDHFTQIYDFVLSYQSIGLFFESNLINHELLKIKIINCLKHNLVRVGDNLTQTRIFKVCYDGEDLDYLAKFHRLSKQQIIDIHQQAEYTVATIGFLPNFPYLIGLDKRLYTPRRNKVKKYIKAGSVAIGGGQTGVYPQDSPGAWHIIAHLSNLDILAKTNIGDKVIFNFY